MQDLGKSSGAARYDANRSPNRSTFQQTQRQVNNNRESMPFMRTYNNNLFDSIEASGGNGKKGDKSMTGSDLLMPIANGRIPMKTSHQNKRINFKTDHSREEMVNKFRSL